MCICYIKFWSTEQFFANVLYVFQPNGQISVELGVKLVCAAGSVSVFPFFCFLFFPLIDSKFFKPWSSNMIPVIEVVSDVWYWISKVEDSSICLANSWDDICLIHRKLIWKWMKWATRSVFFVVLIGNKWQPQQIWLVPNWY